MSQTNIGGPPLIGAVAGDSMGGANPGWGSAGADVAGGKASDCVADAASGARGCAAGAADRALGGEGDGGLVCALRAGPDSAGGVDTAARRSWRWSARRGRRRRLLRGPGDRSRKTEILKLARPDRSRAEAYWLSPRCCFARAQAPGRGPVPPPILPTASANPLSLPSAHAMKRAANARVGHPWPPPSRSSSTSCMNGPGLGFSGRRPGPARCRPRQQC